MFVVLFDIDGTLLASGGAGKAAMESALVEEFQLDGVRRQIPYAGRTDRAIAKDLMEAHGVASNPENWQRLVARYIANLPASLVEHCGSILPGIAALLDQLRTRDNVALGLLTGNLRLGANTKLGHFGLNDYFAFGGFGDHHLCRDDVAREALADARRHLDGYVRLERLWVVGDTPLDIRCARAIGARVAAVATGGHGVEELAAHAPDVLLADFSDATELKRLWS